MYVSSLVLSQDPLEFTFDWLLGVEIVAHPLDPPIEALYLAQNGGQILQDQAPGSIGMFLRELGQVVANASSNIRDEYRICFRACAFDQSLLDGEEVFIHPTGSTLTVTAHVMVELRPEGRVGLQIGEEVKLGIVRILVRPIGRGRRL